MKLRTIIIFSIVVFAVLIGGNICIQIAMDKEDPVKRAKINQALEDNVGKTASPAPRQTKHNLVVSNPEDYGMTVTKREHEPRTQAQWTHYIRQGIQQSGMLDNPKAHQALDKVKKKEEDLERRMNIVDQRIEQFEARLQQEPGDQETEQRLQNLYKLKALGEVLGPRVILP